MESISGCNGNTILGIHLEYIMCCYVGQTSGKIYGCQDQLIDVKMACITFRYGLKVKVVKKK